MISLLAIRSKYLYRHPCLLFWSYMFLPGVVFLLSYAVLRLGRAPPLPMQEKIEPMISGEDYFFDQEINNTRVKRNYTTLKTILPNMTVMMNNDSKCKEIEDFFFQETNFTINCTLNRRNFSNDTTYIIKMEQKEEKYSISLIERQSDLHADFIYQRKDIDQDKTANVFITVNETRNTSIFEDERFVFYWELQSFLAKMLIKLNKKEIKNDMKVTIGFNGYPQQYRYTDTTGYGIAAFLSFMLALQFSLIGYNFNMRMIDEKENKLNILLERQGISKFKYFLSWFVTFYVIFSFSILSYGIFLYLSVRNRLTLLFLTMVLYTLSIFTSSIFFTTITKSAKTGTSAVKFFNFGSILMGFVIVLPKTARMTKYFFGLIPQINIFLSLYTVFHYDNFDYISWDRLWVKAGRISYMESTLLFIFDIVFYLVTSIIIQSYKDSGLEFCDYIKSFIFRVSRKVNHPNYSHEEERLNEYKFTTHHQELSNKNRQKKGRK